MKPIESRVLSEEEANECLDRWFIEKFGRTFREPLPTPEKPQADSLTAIMRDFPALFDSPRSGNA